MRWHEVAVCLPGRKVPIRAEMIGSWRFSINAEFVSGFDREVPGEDVVKVRRSSKSAFAFATETPKRILFETAIGRIVAASSSG